MTNRATMRTANRGMGVRGRGWVSNSMLYRALLMESKSQHPHDKPTT